MEITEKELNDWVASATQLKELKKKEMSLRRKIVSFLLKGEETGRKKTEIWGHKLQAATPTKIVLDEELLQAAWPSLTQGEKNVITFKPALQKKMYDSLMVKESGKNLNCAISFKPGTPTLKAL